MIQLKLILLGVAIIGSIGLALYSSYQTHQHQQHYQQSSYRPEPPPSNTRFSLATSKRKRRQYLQSEEEDINSTWSSQVGECDVVGTSSPPKHETNKTEQVNSSCSICLSNSDMQVTQLCCGHRFHMNCIMSWLNKGSTSCPNCRAKVV